MERRCALLIISLAGTLCVQIPDACAEVRIPESAHNFLVDAKIRGNLESYGEGLRGEVDHMIYDLQRGRFVKSSQWHEYGVGFGRGLGIVAEDKPAWWMAEWPKDIEANMIVLSGVYDNQPQPQTGWKIELRHKGKWRTHERGVGGWYDRGRYVWGGLGTKPIEFDALRVSVFSKDKQTTIKSIHFCGENGLSWLVAYCPPIDARLNQLRWAIRAGEAVSFGATRLLGEINSWKWDFDDGTVNYSQNTSHCYDYIGLYNVTLTVTNNQSETKTDSTIHIANFYILTI